MKPITTVKAPAAIGPYSQAVEANGFLFVSGQLPIDVSKGNMPQGAAEQSKQSLENIRHILAEAGSSMGKVVRTTIYLKNMEDFAAVNEVYAQFFQPPYPARVTIEVARLPKDALVEIDAVAVKL